jgi:hypothetical protein
MADLAAIIAIKIYYAAADLAYLVTLHAIVRLPDGLRENAVQPPERQLLLPNRQVWIVEKILAGNRIRYRNGAILFKMTR